VHHLADLLIGDPKRGNFHLPTIIAYQYSGYSHPEICILAGWQSIPRGAIVKIERFGCDCGEIGGIELAKRIPELEN
jgi:hypothetical protein